MVNIDICKQKEISGILVRFEKRRDSLLPILIEVNRIHGFITPIAMAEIAEFLEIPVAEVHGVVSFYHFLSTKKRGKYTVRLCKTISCEMAGKEKIEKILKKELRINFGETTSDGLFTLEYTNCIGMCDKSPAMLVNDNVYFNLTPEKVIKVIDELRKRD